MAERIRWVTVNGRRRGQLPDGRFASRAEVADAAEWERIKALPDEDDRLSEAWAKIDAELDP